MRFVGRTPLICILKQSCAVVTAGSRILRTASHEWPTKIVTLSMLPNDVTRGISNGRILRGKSALRLPSVASSNTNARRIAWQQRACGVQGKQAAGGETRLLQSQHPNLRREHSVRRGERYIHTHNQVNCRGVAERYTLGKGLVYDVGQCTL